MVDRERLSEIAGRAAWLSHYDDDPAPGIEEALASQMGKDALAALEAAGYAWYRPDDCAEATVEHGGSYPDPYTGEEREAEPVLRSNQIETTRCILTLGTYRLVPVGGDS